MNNNINRELNYDLIVEKQMVHRESINEVFLTCGKLISENKFECGVQFPRTHIYFNEHTHKIKSYDILLVIEIFRQASIFISHNFLGVPLDYKFVYLSGNTKIISQEALLINDSPTNARMCIDVKENYIRKEVRSGVTLEMTIFVNEIAAVKKNMSIRWMDSNVWNTLRERGLANIPIPFDASIQLKTPISQKAVGRELQCNVVVGQDIIYTENGIESRVIVNQKNSGLFDHSLDHIPGMLIIEAFRQTAILLLTNHFKVDANEVLLIQCDVNFSKFGEFGMETVCSASLIENGYKNNIYHINSFINQLGEVIATCNLQFTVIKKTISC